MAQGKVLLHGEELESLMRFIVQVPCGLIWRIHIFGRNLAGPYFGILLGPSIIHVL